MTFENIKAKFLALKRPLQIFIVGAVLLVLLGMCSSAVAQEPGECEVVEASDTLNVEVCILEEPVCVPSAQYNHNWSVLGESINGVQISGGAILGYYGPGNSALFIVGGPAAPGVVGLTFVAYEQTQQVCLEATGEYSAKNQDNPA